jgi:hypothetical protein
LLTNAPCVNKKESSNPLTVRLPNGQTMDSTHTAHLDIPKLCKAASVAHIFSAMENKSLLLVGELCDEGYSFMLSISKVKNLDSKHKTLLIGSRDLNAILWRINLRQRELHTRGGTAKTQTQIYEANNFYDLRNTGALVNYLYKAMFSCTKSAIINAVKKGHLATWPGLPEDAINKYLKMTPATVKSESEDEDITPSGKGGKTHLIFAVVLDQGQIYTDLTGNFPARSSKGNNVLMVCYSYDEKYIRAITMK